jgi:hypothetical protein
MTIIARPPLVVACQGASEMRVDALHGHRALPHRRRAALGRAGADVAGRVDARHAGLQQVLGMRVGAREDEAVLVAGHGVAEPVRARARAEEEEQERERHALAALEGHRFEVTVRAVAHSDAQHAAGLGGERGAWRSTPP